MRVHFGALFGWNIKGLYGIMQSSTLVLSYLMKKENWSFRQAC